jgi:hypothetical protein
MAVLSSDQLLATLSEEERLVLSVLGAGNVITAGPINSSAMAELRKLGLIVIGPGYSWYLTARGLSVANALRREVTA